MAVSEEEILMTIVVKVKDSHPPTREEARNLPQIGRQGRIAKAPVSVVVKEGKIFIGQGCCHNVWIAVIINVGKIGSHSRKRFAILRIPHACRFTHFDKSPITIVLEEELRKRIISHRDIQKPIVIKI